MDSLDVALMKVDVQGMECQVLAGARSLLHRMRIVTAEVTPHLLTLQECSVEDLRTSLLLDPPWQARAIAYLPDAHYRDATFVSMCAHASVCTCRGWGICDHVSEHASVCTCRLGGAYVRERTIMESVVEETSLD